MYNKKYLIFRTLAKDIRRLECFLFFLDFNTQAGQRPPKSFKNTKLSLFKCTLRPILDENPLNNIIKLTHYYEIVKCGIYRKN